MRNKLASTAVLCLAGFALLATPALSESTYRSDQPAVMTPPPPKPRTDKVAEEKIIADFDELYKTKGRPKIVLFWNKQLNDQLSDFQTEARITHYKQEHWNQKQGNGQGQAGSKTDDKDTTHFERNDVNLDVRKEDKARPALGPLANDRMQGAFSATFQDARVRFLDRALLMRLTENDQRNNNAVDQPIDSKATEIDAVSKHADLLIEVSMVRDPSTHAGMAYQVQISDIKSAEVLAQFVARDQGGTADRQRWEAGDHGYELVTIPGYADFTQSGRALAIKTMEQLLQWW